jgi:N-acyl homoserine lactone hydrolase
MADFRRSVLKRLLQLVAFVGVAFAVYRYGHTYPFALPHRRVPAKFDAIPDVSLCWVEFARRETSGQAATAGLSGTKPWSVTVSGLLVRHPRGDVLLDAGNSSKFLEELRSYGMVNHLLLTEGPGSNRLVSTAPDAIRLRGADPKNLKWAILSHAHIDHAGGLVDLPGVPVLLPQEEIDFITTFGKMPGNLNVVPAHAKALEGRMNVLRFEAKPYETFDESADIFGDGTLVIVKLPGHTPGSIGTFVNLSPTRRLLHVGDTVSVLEGIDRRVGKSLPLAWTDFDPDQVGEEISKLAQLHEVDPSLPILPAHDRSAWVSFFGDTPTCVRR